MSFSLINQRRLTQLMLGFGAFLALSFSNTNLGAHNDQMKTKVMPGVEVLFAEDEYLNMLKGKRIGLITNPTGVDSKCNSTIDLIHQHPDLTLAKLYGPEHGVRGDAYAGEKLANTVDKRTGVPVMSLYGKTRRPTKEMLDGIDIMVYDIQDVGSRSYTYIYTMAYCMEECAKRGIPFVVLDRPNPCGAHIVDGNILDTDEYKTFVGLYEIPYQYGLTPGETAYMFNKEYNSDECELFIVPMKGYKRSMMQWDTGLPFIPTSTHIPRADVAVYYNLTGIIGEVRHVSIGVGYTLPFEVIAAPWIDRYKLTEALRAKNLPGLLFRLPSHTNRVTVPGRTKCATVYKFTSKITTPFAPSPRRFTSWKSSRSSSPRPNFLTTKTPRSPFLTR
jgi:uncharacterized protein YbbC (DUF1343 family)